MRKRPAHQRRRPFGLGQRLRTCPFEGAAVSNHSFTCKFEEGRHTTEPLIIDHKQRRAYDAERHELSRRLPAIVDALPTASVYLTPTDRNYVVIANITTADGRQYPMHFNLRRAPPGHSSHLLMSSRAPIR
jgi:hypothetical protein